MEPYYDRTDFESSSDPWNGWSRPPCGNTLTIDSTSGNHFADFDACSSVLISKTLEGLTPKAVYRLSIRVRRKENSSTNSTLGFALDGIPLGIKQEVTDTQWRTLYWTFQPAAEVQQMQLVVQEQGAGTDNWGLNFDDIRICIATYTESFEGQADRLINAGGLIQLPTMTLHLLESPAAVRAGIIGYSYPVPGFMHGKAISLQHGQSNPPAVQRMRIDLAVPCGHIKFAWSWRQRPGEVRFLDEEGNLLEALGFDSDPKDHWVECRAPAERYIASMIVTARDWGFLDLFTMTQPDA
jgi:hypothetical protein